jgi:ABC-type transport system involved in multi-copper enzyme maturation permease subunit
LNSWGQALDLATIVFGHLAGPECRRALARGWLLVVRTLAGAALGVLLVALLWIWWLTSLIDPWSVPVWWFANGLAAAMMVLLTIVVVQAPAVLAGSLAGERERGVLQLLLTTAATPREIVIGRVLGKLSQVGMIVLAGLPILGMLFAWNGLGLSNLATFFLLLTAVGFGGGGLAVGASIVSRRGRDALLSVYILMLVLLLSPLLSWVGLPVEVAEWLLWFNPFFCLNELAHEGQNGPALAASAFWIAIGVAGMTVAAWRLRPSCLSAGDTVKKSKRPRWVPLLGDRPMIWKELYIERVGTLGRFGRWLGVLITVAVGGGSLVLGAVILLDIFWPRADGFAVQATNFFSVVLSGAGATFMGWLLQWAIGLRAAVSIASERERGTWDALLMSPLQPREIVPAKVLGSVHALRWMAAAMVIAWTVAVVVGAIPVHSYIVWIVGNTMSGALMAAIGVRASLSLPTATKAMAWTISMWLVSEVAVAMFALTLIALAWMIVFASWSAAVSYGYIVPSSTPWIIGLSWETGWPLTTNLVTALFTALIVLDTSVRFDQVAGRMAGGAVATTVDEFLHGRQNQPVFLPTKKAAKAKKAAPLPLEAAAEPVGSLEVSLE